MKPGVAVRDAKQHDLREIRELLGRHALPTADLDSSQVHFVVARDGAALVAAGGLEIHGSAGLLRSIVVADRHRRSGLGRALVSHVETLARRRGVEELVLLTESAGAFFARLGYTDIARDRAPESVRDSAEFKSLCPLSARCMQKRLATGRGAAKPR
ncbi:MAG: arsenic resistance N-acetyltransferase ArsN2 [Steroidobacteraceae bacterium]